MQNWLQIVTICPMMVPYMSTQKEFLVAPYLTNEGASVTRRVTNIGKKFWFKVKCWGANPINKISRQEMGKIS